MKLHTVAAAPHPIILSLRAVQQPGGSSEDIFSKLAVLGVYPVSSIAGMLSAVRVAGNHCSCIESCQLLLCVRSGVPQKVPSICFTRRPLAHALGFSHATYIGSFCNLSLIQTAQQDGTSRHKHLCSTGLPRTSAVPVDRDGLQLCKAVVCCDLREISSRLRKCSGTATHHSRSSCKQVRQSYLRDAVSYQGRCQQWRCSLLHERSQAATAVTAARSRCRLTCQARRTKSGGGEQDIKQATKATTNGTASSRSNTPAPSKGSSNNGRSPHNRNKKQQVSQLEAFVRDTPVLNRFLDGTLVLGDAVMLIATEASSERVPTEQIPALAAVAVGSWIIAGAVLGDYAMEPDPDENPLSNAMGWPIFQAVVNAMITWAVSMVVSIIGFSWLVSNFIVEAETVLELTKDGMLSPQLEISVAMLITMACWRGMAARLRL